MMNNADHSFYILAYHESPFIEECIESLKHQTVKSDICITTSTPSEFLEKLSLKHNIPLIINSKREGIAGDWSFAYNSARTDYITLAHQDDVYLPEYSATNLLALMDCPDSLIAFSNYIELRGNQEMKMTFNIFVKILLLRIFFLFRNTLRHKTVKRLFLSFGNPISCPGVTYNKKNIGPFDFSRDLDINLDWNAWLDFSQRNGAFVYIKKKLFLHRVHEDAESMKGMSDERRLREDKMMLEKIWPKGMHQIMSAFYSFSRKGW